MKLTLDIDIVPVISEDTSLSIYEVMYLYLLYKGNKDSPKPQSISRNLSKYIIDLEEEILNEKECRELFNKYLIAQQTHVPVNMKDIDNWITTRYREHFRGKCNAAKPMGDKQTVITRMKWFLERYPEYNNINLIEKAAKYGIETIRKKYGEKYIPQADNFIYTEGYKTQGGFPVTGKTYKPKKEHLSAYCEMILLDEKKQVKVNEGNNLASITI